MIVGHELGANHCAQTAQATRVQTKQTIALQHVCVRVRVCVCECAQHFHIGYGDKSLKKLLPTHEKSTDCATSLVQQSKIFHLFPYEVAIRRERGVSGGHGLHKCMAHSSFQFIFLYFCHFLFYYVSSRASNVLSYLPSAIL